LSLSLACHSPVLKMKPLSEREMVRVTV